MNYNETPSEATIQNAVKAIEGRGIEVAVVNSRQDALGAIKQIIPSGASVMNGSSTTLKEIGFIDFLKSTQHSWENLHDEIMGETDPEKQAKLRRQSVTADYFLASVNAIAETGELVAVGASGSRVGAFPFAAGKLILVSGVNKIVPTLKDAMQRIREYVYPLENERAKKAYGMESTIGKWVIIEREIMPGRITLILVKEKLGF